MCLPMAMLIRSCARNSANTTSKAIISELMKSPIATVSPSVAWFAGFAAVLVGVLVAGLPATSAAQVPASSSPRPAAGAKKVAAGRSECAVAIGLCVTVPTSWQRLGDIFDDLGFVVAEPHPGADSAASPQLTVAAIDVPPQKNGDATVAPSLDALVETLLTPDGSFTSAETLERTHLMLNGADAEIVRVHLHEDAGTSESNASETNASEASQSGAIEEIALILGPDRLVYSIALRCAPKDFARVEPVFQKAAHSWRIKETALQPAPPANKQDSEKK